MLTALVTGGTGNLGRCVVRRLLYSGHHVRIASRADRPPAVHPDPEWARVDYATRAGLDDALDGVDVVLHCAGGSARAQAETMAALLSSGRRAGLAHLVYISVVGVDRLPLGYYRSKLAAENALIASGLGWTILRATQFHDLALRLVRAMCGPPVAVIPRGISCQSVAAPEVAGRLVELAGQAPAGRAPEFGGPQIKSYAQLAEEYLTLHQRHKRIAAVPVPGAVARGLRAGYGLTPDHRDGGQTFAEFLESVAAPW